jgi:hypothetical protein
MKTALAIAFSSVLFAACTDDPTENFLGTYKATVTVSGNGSQTFPDTIAISEGQTTDLIMNSQQLGSVKIAIIGDTSFEIEQQQITLVDPASGQVATVNIEGQGTVNDGVLAASGQMSALTSTFALTMSGQRQ